jgi:hypothetical protein
MQAIVLAKAAKGVSYAISRDSVHGNLSPDGALSGPKWELDDLSSNSCMSVPSNVKYSSELGKT